MLFRSAWAAAVIQRDANVTSAQRVKSMFAEAFAREPSPAELAKALAYLADLARDASVPDAKIGTDERVWQDFAQSLFNLKEFIYVR